MLRVNKAAASAVHRNKVVLSLVGEDRKLHEIVLPPTVAMQAAISLFRSVCDLPQGNALTQTQLTSLFEALFMYLGT